MKTPTISCHTCGYVQAQHESILRCFDCGTRLLLPKLLEVQVQVQEQEEEQEQHLSLQEETLPSPVLSEEEEKPTTLDLAGFKHLLPFLQEMFRSDQETKLQQILDRMSLVEQLQVKLSHAPEVHVYVPESTTPPTTLHETVVNLPRPTPLEPRKTVKIVERDERGLIVKITEQDEEHTEKKELED